MGHRTAAGEGQEDSAEDQTLQDETGTEGTLLCRCKDVRLVCVWGRTVLPVSTQIFGYYLFIFIYFLGGGSFCRGHFYKWVCVSPQFGVSFRMQLHVQYTSACIYLSLFTHSFDTI